MLFLRDKKSPKLMRITSISILFVTILSATTSINAQIIYDLEAQAIGTTNNTVPLWMRSNQFGSIPTSGLSTSFLGKVVKDYKDGEQKSRFDWGGGLEGRLNLGKDSKAILIEAYAKLRYGIFQFKGGRYREVMGLNPDTILSSGNFSVAGNALGIPQLEISIPEYEFLPIFNRTVAIKGNFSHGWVGNVPITEWVGVNSRSLVDEAATYFHQKSLYVRIGKEGWKLKLLGGFNHQVYWGNERKIYGDRFGLSPLKTFFYIATGKTYGDRNIDIPTSKIGNQLGSIDLGLEYNLPDVIIKVTRQNFYDVGALSKLANIRDGLNSVLIENKAETKSQKIRWKKALFEFLYTKHQAGEFGSIATKSGDEDYYNNSFYTHGWSYKGQGLGNPLLTPKHFARSNLPSHPADYFINNRVIAFHSGLEVSVASWDFRVKATYSSNYGTFGTSPEGHSTGEITGAEPIYGLFGKLNQFSGYLEGNKLLKTQWRLGFAAALDNGSLLNNSNGLLLKIGKRF